MKKFFLLSTAFIFSLTMNAQGNSNDNGKGNDKSKNEKTAKQGSSEQKEKEHMKRNSKRSIIKRSGMALQIKTAKGRCHLKISRPK
jgi:hypothetical protein